MNIDQQITVKRMSQLKLYSSNLLCGLYSLTVKHKLRIFSHIQLSDYFTIGLIIERYFNIFLEHQ